MSSFFFIHDSVTKNLTSLDLGALNHSLPNATSGSVDQGLITSADPSNDPRNRSLFHI